jgi:hypothetical protein
VARSEGENERIQLSWPKQKNHYVVFRTDDVKFTFETQNGDYKTEATLEAVSDVFEVDNPDDVKRLNLAVEQTEVVHKVLSSGYRSSGDDICVTVGGKTLGEQKLPFPLVPPANKDEKGNILIGQNDPANPCPDKFKWRLKDRDRVTAAPQVTAAYLLTDVPKLFERGWLLSKDLKWKKRSWRSAMMHDASVRGQEIAEALGHSKNSQVHGLMTLAVNWGLFLIQKDLDMQKYVSSGLCEKKGKFVEISFGWGSFDPYLKDVWALTPKTPLNGVFNSLPSAIKTLVSSRGKAKLLDQVVRDAKRNHKKKREVLDCHKSEIKMQAAEKKAQDKNKELTKTVAKTHQRKRERCVKLIATRMEDINRARARADRFFTDAFKSGTSKAIASKLWRDNFGNSSSTPIYATEANSNVLNPAFEYRMLAGGQLRPVLRFVGGFNDVQIPPSRVEKRYRGDGKTVRARPANGWRVKTETAA